MEFNWLSIILATLVPTVVGALWYGPIFGKAWVKSTGKTEEELREGFNMPLVMGLSLVGSFLMAVFLDMFLMGIHKGSDHASWFGHGAFHGVFIALLLLVPVIMVNGLYDRKSWTNILLSFGYWILTVSLMCGVLDWL